MTEIKINIVEDLLHNKQGYFDVDGLMLQLADSGSILDDNSTMFDIVDFKAMYLGQVEYHDHELQETLEDEEYEEEDEE